ncbi:hypothetical protein DV451_003921 [Geotrichum candidum]|uniref:Mitochondrial pyruvate carrier n=1 Tax=Geotrichum candidum TaxID=1173061 RepID=A0A9P5KS09_GEOCN|nr:hypothetical protein DV451_003921 [Geotrichum candidum]KAF5108599.1 hypothetical protein DV453_002192 [Geotrichum candidum]KAF5113564.1 hypothetical protein DV454_003510 [Geotrichum candidum]KAF7501872.1 hypothetical protein DV113_000006 [Geotrichum candidum]KAI8131426.1 hypothetical protein DUD61_004920 [Geotrichum candidum]
MASKFARFMNSETGPKTIHFWRPVESMSGTQQLALLATGVIWTRWCLIIKPKNYLLASVNFFLGTVAGYQVFRIYNYQREVKQLTVGESILAMVKTEEPKKEPATN